MGKIFLSGRWRPNIWPFWILTGLELALTIALLIFVGLASPNEYRTKLWQDGANNGFNSSPLAGLYAAANYRPYKTPLIWSQFLTDYELVIVVLTMFVMLLKSTLFIVHCFPPIVSVAVHVIEIILYTISVGFQLSPDTSDPQHPQTGPAWYISKSCSVTLNKSLVGYCQQAKATFACTVAILGIFVVYLGFAVFSCFPSKEHVAEWEEKRRLRKEKYASMDDSPLDYYENSKTPLTSTFPVANTQTLNPVTPRTFAFNKLSGTKSGPLKISTSNSNSTSTSTQNQTQNQIHVQTHIQTQTNVQASGAVAATPMFFPPPPRVSDKKGKK